MGDLTQATPPSTPTNVAEQLKALRYMNAKQLKAEWRRLYHIEPPAQLRRDLMIRVIAYKVQERARGGLKGPVKRKLKAAMAELEQGQNTGPSPAAKLQPGIRLIREWHGKRYDIEVLENGFEFEGRRYNSLTAIAKEITGTHWSGPRFFGLDKPGKADAQLAEASHD